MTVPIHINAPELSEEEQRQVERSKAIGEAYERLLALVVSKAPMIRPVVVKALHALPSLLSEDQGRVLGALLAAAAEQHGSQIDAAALAVFEAVAQ